MTFKLISKDGDFLPLVLRMQEAGHEIKVFIESDKAKNMFDGLLYKVKSPLDLDIQKDDIVLFDMVGGGESAELLKNKGYQVVGGGMLNDQLELNRQTGDDFMNRHGLKTPPSEVFWDFLAAREFLQATPGRFVFKPNGNLDTDLTYVSEDAEDLLAMLPYLEDRCPEDVNFELQEFVDGIEMSTEAWFNGTRFLLPINSTLEEKPLMVGGIGPNTGCMGNVVWWWPQDISQLLYERFFQPMEDELRDSGYVGPLDFNAIWTPQGPLGLELTTRFGYDAIQALSRIIDQEFGEFLAGLPLASSIPTTPNYSVAVRVSIPPYPHEGDVPEVPIRGIIEDNKDNIYLSDIKLGDMANLVCAGSDGYVLSVCADSPRLSQCVKTVYDTIDTLVVPNKQYRTDIGERISEKLLVRGWIKNLYK
jgi:phosphoribosylamine--glycine ligase